ncbi:MAG TPA: hypothetical protein VEL82_00945 [Thermoplasmata archaeon]|nr:hypothetical protein [Thermoplasmata archaeon]
MIPVGWLALGLLPILVLASALIGSMIRWAVSALLPPASADPPATWAAILGRLIEDAALGLSVVPILYLVATIAGLSIGTDVAWALLLLAAAIFLVRGFLARKRFGAPLGRRPAPPARVEWFLFGVVVVVVVARIASYVPYLVYAGDDIRMFTLITQLVEAHGHFVTSWAPYAEPSWNPVVAPHLRFAGSEAIFATVNAWVPWNAPQLVSAAVIDVGILIPFAGFVLFRAAFPTRSPWTATLGALALGMFSAYPLFYQDWGGIDEQVNWLLVPVALAFFLAALRSPRFLSAELVLAGLVFGGAVIVNPYPFAYVGVFVVAAVLGAFALRSGAVRALARGAVFYLFGVAIASPILYAEIADLSTANALSPPGYAGWGVFQSDVILVPGEPLATARNLLFLHTGILGTGVVVVLGWLGLALALVRYRERHAFTLLGLGIGLLLLNSNGPFGPYWVQYPGWSFLYADRPLEWMFLPLAAGTGWLLATLLERGPPASVATAPVPRRSAWSLPRSDGRPLSKRQVAFVALLLLGTAASVQVVIDNAETVGWGTELTPADLAAFAWMQSHLPANATLLVTDADAGTWIPQFTDLKVFPYPELISSPSVYEASTEIPALFNTSEYAPTLSFLHAFNISGAYWGARNGYSSVPSFDPAKWVAPRPILDFASRYSVCESPEENLPLFLLCNGDSVTFRGPVVVNLTEYHDLEPIGMGLVAIANGTSWTFTLASGTPPFPGDWSASFEEHPLGTWAYYSGNAELAMLDPQWTALETAPPGVTITVVAGELPQT